MSINDYSIHYKNKELSIFLELTTYCNAGCPQCHRTDRNGISKAKWLPLKHWTLEQVKNVFNPRTLESIELIELCGTWGDPIMNKDVYSIIQYMIENSNANILINTNGSIRNPKWWGSLGEISNGRITVMWAIDGSTQDIHNFYRQNTNLELILENMKAFTGAGGKSEIFTIVFKHNQTDLYDIAMLGKQNGAKAITFVQSNRFRPGETKYYFTDPTGKEYFLEETTLENNRSFYWTSLSLYDENSIKRIKEESIKGKL